MRLAGTARRELRAHWRSGQLALLAGITIFLLCMTLRELLGGALPSVPKPLDEGLIILAWLALWRPAERLAYEWLPLRRKLHFYERLAACGCSFALRPPNAHLDGQPGTTSGITLYASQNCWHHDSVMTPCSEGGE